MDWHKVVSVILLVLVLSVPVYAQEESAVKPLVDKINKVTRGVQAILLPIASLVFIYAGYLHMTAEGQPEKEQKARKTFIGGTIGLALILLSEIIKQVIINLLK